MHYTLTNLYAKLKEKENVLTGRVQVAVGNIRNQRKCLVTVVINEIPDTDKLEEKKHHYSGYLVPTNNTVESDSSIFLVVPVYRNRMILDYFEFGFNKRMLYGSYMLSSGNYSYERKEIKKIEIRLVEPGLTGYVDPKVKEVKPDFIIVEALECLKNKLIAYLNKENIISISFGNNLSDGAIAITLKDDFILPEEKLQEILKQDELSNDLIGYKVTQTLVRSEKTNKILYVIDL